MKIIPVFYNQIQGEPGQHNRYKGFSLQKHPPQIFGKEASQMLSQENFLHLLDQRRKIKRG